MTSTTGTNEVLRQDRRGRVRVPRGRRDALLDEFSRGGVSAAEFARMAGIKYSTFANWLQERRKARPSVVEESREVLVGGGVRLLEAVVEDRVIGTARNNAGLCIELPGGGRLTVHSPAQLAMTAELLNLMAQRNRGC